MNRLPDLVSEALLFSEMQAFLVRSGIRPGEVATISVVEDVAEVEEVEPIQPPKGTRP